MKPSLFNTEMVRAILDGRKTQTRRIVKPQPPEGADVTFVHANYEGDLCGLIWQTARTKGYQAAPYQPGDILYVRETWSELKYPDGSRRYVYKASDEYPFGEDGYIVKFRWRPSIHMPKEAARIFLRVTDVRAERLQEISPRDVKKEGIVSEKRGDEFDYEASPEVMDRFAFEEVWDSTIKKADLDRYGWAANPWVWVISFKRCGKEGESWNG